MQGQQAIPAGLRRKAVSLRLEDYVVSLVGFFYFVLSLFNIVMRSILTVSVILSLLCYWVSFLFCKIFNFYCHEISSWDLVSSFKFEKSVVMEINSADCSSFGFFFSLTLSRPIKNVVFFLGTLHLSYVLLHFILTPFQCLEVDGTLGL